MKRNYINLRDYLENRFPHLVGRIRGENYPIPPFWQMMSTVVGSLQTLSIVLVFLGGNRFVQKRMVRPEWFESAQNNKLRVFAGFFMLNMFVQNAAQSGAFEVSYAGKMIYSKLETGKMPNIDIILGGLEGAGALIQ